MMSDLLNGGGSSLLDDHGYYQYVANMLDESENNLAFKKELEESLGLGDDFLPHHNAEFGVRDRAFSWDLGFEEQIHAEVRKRSNSIKYFDPNDFRFLEPAYKKQYRGEMSMESGSGSGATTVMPVFTSAETDSGNTRIGAYTREERQILIEKFRAKKKRRVWRKQIKYDCRKRLADTRPRVKGRFVSRKDKDGNSDGDSEEAHQTELYHDGIYDDDGSP